MKLKKEKIYTNWIIYLAISLIILGVDSLGWLSGIKTLTQKAINPATKIVKNSSQIILKPFQVIKFASTGPKKIQNLESRYAEAIVSLDELENLKKENQALKKLLGNNPSQEFEYIPVSIVGGVNQIIVSKGQQSGISQNDTVITPEKTLAGIVAKTTPFTSWINTPINSSSKIAVVIGPNKTPAILTGNGNTTEAQLEQSEKISLGDIVSTSGTNGIYVPGILIGKVDYVQEESANVYKKITVKPLLDPQDTLLIIKTNK